MGSGKRPAADAAVYLQPLRRQVLDVDRSLAVPELAYVEVSLLVVDPIRRQPPQENVARGLHQPLALDHPLAVVFELALADVGLEHRGLGLLGLQEERVLSVAAHHQRHPGPRPDAAYPDHLAGHLDEPEAVEEVAAIALETLAVTAEHLEDPLLELVGLILGDELRGRDQQRRIADDPWLAIDHPDEAIEGLHAVLLFGLRHGLVRRLHLLVLGDLGQVGEDGVDVEARVPDVEVVHRGELAHRLTVGADRAEDRGASLLRREVAVAPGDLEARRETLDVPLPGPRKGFVEVVDVQHQTAIRCGEDPEVREVGIATCLDAQPGLGGLREVHRHDRRRATKERERRGQHPPEADRHQLRHAALVLVLEHLDRVSPARRRLPFPVARARDLLPRRLAGGCALLGGGGGYERRFGRSRRAWPPGRWLGRCPLSLPYACGPGPEKNSAKSAILL